MIFNVPKQRFGITNETEDVQKTMETTIKKAKKAGDFKSRWNSLKYNKNVVKLIKKHKADMAILMKKYEEATGDDKINIKKSIDKMALINEANLKGVNFSDNLNPLMPGISKFREHEEEMANDFNKFLNGNISKDDYYNYVNDLYTQFVNKWSEKEFDTTKYIQFIKILDIIEKNTDNFKQKILSKDSIDMIMNELLTYSDKKFNLDDIRLMYDLNEAKDIINNKIEKLVETENIDNLKWLNQNQQKIEIEEEYIGKFLDDSDQYINTGNKSMKINMKPSKDKPKKGAFETEEKFKIRKDEYNNYSDRYRTNINKFNRKIDSIKSSPIPDYTDIDNKKLLTLVLDSIMEEKLSTIVYTNDIPKKYVFRSLKLFENFVDSKYFGNKYRNDLINNICYKINYDFYPKTSKTYIWSDNIYDEHYNEAQKIVIGIISKIGEIRKGNIKPVEQTIEPVEQTIEPVEQTIEQPTEEFVITPSKKSILESKIIKINDEIKRLGHTDTNVKIKKHEFLRREIDNIQKELDAMDNRAAVWGSVKV